MLINPKGARSGWRWRGGVASADPYRDCKPQLLAKLRRRTTARRFRLQGAGVATIAGGHNMMAACAVSRLRNCPLAASKAVGKTDEGPRAQEQKAGGKQTSSSLADMTPAPCTLR